MKLCFDAHKEQVDNSGVPYVFHCIHIAEQMHDEDTTIIALLHDIVEDTEYTIEDLRTAGFSEDVLEAVLLLTHDKAVPYMEYVERIKMNRMASVVKYADLTHNSDLTRLDIVDEKAFQRIEKYKQAIAILNDR